MTDEDLARRSIVGFGEMVAALGRSGVGGGREIRRPDLLGARIELARENPWMDAVVVPPGETPPPDEPGWPLCIWSLADEVPGRLRSRDFDLPCLGMHLEDLVEPPGADVSHVHVETPSLVVLGEINERAYGQFGVFLPLISAVVDDRVRAHGLRDASGSFVTVALTMTVGDDLSVQYVATEEAHRRQGLASNLLAALLHRARLDGLRTSTLQASPDGLPVYERLGYRRVATLGAFLREGN